jgi:hypothetical protein
LLVFAPDRDRFGLLDLIGADELIDIGFMCRTLGG